MVSDASYSGHRPDMINWVPDHYSRVLEIGSADGGFRQELDPLCEYWGVEPNTMHTSQSSGFFTKLLSGTYLDVHNELPDYYFDLVICNDVIEHMPDHDRFFEMIKSKMTDNAYLIGSIPNIRYARTLYELLINKDWQYSRMGVLDTTHLRYFTEKSLKRTFAEHGFAIRRFDGINSTLAHSSTPWKMLRNILIHLLILFSFGYYADVQYPQFAFQLQYRKPNLL